MEADAAANAPPMGRPGRTAAGLIVLVGAPVGLAFVRVFVAGQQACVAESELREGLKVSHEYEELCFSPERGAEDSNTALYYGEACFDASRGWLVEWRRGVSAHPSGWTDGKRKDCDWSRKEDNSVSRQWNEEWMGGCGTPPRRLPHLPTRLCDASNQPPPARPPTKLRPPAEDPGPVPYEDTVFVDARLRAEDRRTQQVQKDPGADDDDETPGDDDDDAGALDDETPSDDDDDAALGRPGIPDDEEMPGNAWLDHLEAAGGGPPDAVPAGGEDEVAWEAARALADSREEERLQTNLTQNSSAQHERWQLKGPGRRPLRPPIGPPISRPPMMLGETGHHRIRGPGPRRDHHPNGTRHDLHPNVVPETFTYTLTPETATASPGAHPSAVLLETTTASPGDLPPPERQEADVVLVYIAFAKCAHSWLFGASLTTLGKVGLWRGPVVVITDMPKCLMRVQGPKAAEAGLNLTLVYSPRKKLVIDMKIEKTDIWEHVEKAGFNPKLLVYIDEDLIVMRPVQFFVDYLNEHHPTADIMMFRDSKHHLWAHGGLMATRPTDKARKCLGQWKAKIRKAKKAGEHLDQPALDATACRHDGTIQIMETGWSGGLFTWPTGKALQMKDTVVWLHFTNNGRMKGNIKGSKGITRKQVATFFGKRLKLKGDPWSVAECNYEDE